MPYKLNGKKVMVFRSGKWRKLKEHPTVEKAKKHLAALRINVEGKHR